VTNETYATSGIVNWTPPPGSPIPVPGTTRTSQPPANVETLTGLRGGWRSAQFTQNGDWLTFSAEYSVPGAPAPAHFSSRINLRDIERTLLAQGARQLKRTIQRARVAGDCVGCGCVGGRDYDVCVAGLFSKVKKAVKKNVKKVAKVKLLKDVRKQADNFKSTSKKVLKSKVTGGLVAATAIAFPPVGVPAAAAYATANAALIAIERAEALKKSALAAKKSLKLGKAAAAKLKKLPAASRKIALADPKISKVVKDGLAAKRLLDKATKSPEIAKVAKQAKQAKALVAKVSKQAKDSKRKAQMIAAAAKRNPALRATAVEATKKARVAAGNVAILRSVNANRKQAANQHHGILIDAQGRQRRGTFTRRGDRKVAALVTSDGKVQTGEFS
jgi:hypothetical protein